MTHVRGLRVERHVHELGHVVRDGREPLQAVTRDRVVTHLQGEVRDDRREVAVAGALAVTVDRPLHLSGATPHAGQRVRHAGTRVVVQVHRDLHVAAEVLHDLRNGPLDIGRQRAAVGVAQHQVTRAVRRRRFEHAERELGVAAEAVEEVLGVEQHVHARPAQELDRIADHRHALVERGTERFGDVVVPRLPDDAHRSDVRFHEVAQGVVAVDLALRAPRRTERNQRAGLELQLRRRAPEQLVVLRVRTRPTGLDVVHAEPVELLRDPQLVLDRQ